MILVLIVCKGSTHEHKRQHPHRFDYPICCDLRPHSQDCKFRGDELYKGCRCAKHLRYTLAGKQYRQSAHTRFWKTAEERRRSLEASFAVDPMAVVKIEPDSLKTIERMIQLFLTDKKTEGVSRDVLMKYERGLNRFESCMAKRSKFLPHEVGKEDLTEFRADWDRLYPSSTTRSKVQERLKAFFKYCYDARLMDRVPTLSAIKLVETPTLLTETQYKRLLEVIPVQFKGDKAIRVDALIQLMRHTGLAIVDAVTLERHELRKVGDLYRMVTSRQKTGTDVSVPIPPVVVAVVLAAMELNRDERYIFWMTGTGKHQSAVTNWQHDLLNLA